jgi:putative thiamine transport system ATP-binding protein
MLELRGIGITLAGRMLLRPFPLSIGAGEIAALMGPSGCGKSSLLSYIAGDIELPLFGTGNVILNGIELAPLQPAERRIGRMFQDDLLFPHMSVGGNVLFGMSGERREDRMSKALADVGLAGFENRFPASLSGGERQRVALMRALMAEPRAMLLDEPFNRLDAELREAMRELTFSRIREAGIPCLLVTHDRDDAPPDARLLQIGKDGEVRDV